jgi:hypothetical protein
MADGFFVGGSYAPRTNAVKTFVVRGMSYYYAESHYCKFKIMSLTQPHTRADMPLVAPVILAFWSDEE